MLCIQNSWLCSVTDMESCGWTKNEKREGYIIINENSKIVAVGNAASAEES